MSVIFLKPAKVLVNGKEIKGITSVEVNVDRLTNDLEFVDDGVVVETIEFEAVDKQEVDDLSYYKSVRDYELFEKD